MGYLQLAEGDEFTSLAETVIQNRDKYIFIPAGYRGASKDLYVREDFFDGMPDAEYRQMMYELSNYQNTGLSSKASDRRDARKQKKTDAKQKRIETRQAGKGDRAAKRGEIFGKITDTVSGLIGGKNQVEVTAGGGEFNVDTSAQDESWISKNKIPVAIGAIALIGGGIYLATRKKKK